MKKALPLLAILAAVALATWGLASLGGGRGGGEGEGASIEPDGELDEAIDPDASEEERRRAEEARRARIERDFPLHGLVNATQIVVRHEPDPESRVLGWLRLGSHVRLKTERHPTHTCNTGWVHLYPRGWACAGQGIEVSESRPAGESSAAARRDSALPYRYLFVSQPQTPEYHRLPSRDDQRGALAHATRYLELLNGHRERRAELMRQNRVRDEPRSPAAVARYLHRGFYLATNGVEVRASRRFARTVRGTYVKESQTVERTGADFHGVVVDEDNPLPIAWARRAAHPRLRRVLPDGTERFIRDPEGEAYPRLGRVPWVGRAHHGSQVYHELEGEHFLRDWFVSVAQLHDPPDGIAENEPWVHVDLSEQTAVLYRGARPIYATMVSSGLEGHDTPVGEFTIRRKFITDTMANIGPDAGDDAYRIEDVPWTQYFDGSIALHAAFWHERFGLRRSHGCVNLAPRDARYIFERTWPEIPEGWHGVSTERTGFTGSRVIVTE